MKAYKITSITTVTILFLLTVLAANKETNQKDLHSFGTNITFTLSGTVSNGHPSLSWNSVSGTSYYKLHRLPAPYFGQLDQRTEEFVLTSNSHVDTGVHGAVLGSGLQQVRYVIDAHDSNGDVIASAGPVDYTADSVDLN